ncbi:MAG TPA: DUF2993 domain-containing protein [Coleofasciculaceae cyanobacterium]|jgi:hypothetical protein
MELLTILLSGLLTLVSPVGLVIDKVVENNLRSRLNKVEQLQVRVDNAPSYQIVQGKVERVRIAGRGLWLTPDIRIGALEVETDPINVDLQRLRQGGQKSPRASIRQPMQAGVRLLLTQADINKALQSPAVAARLRLIGSRVLGGSPERYEFVNPRVEFLSNKRLRFQVDLLEKDAQPLAFSLESGLGITAGRRLQLIEPMVVINGKALSPQLVSGLTGAINNRFDLRTLEETGILARLLKLDINSGELEVAAFVRVDASNQASAPSTQERRP